MTLVEPITLLTKHRRAATLQPDPQDARCHLAEQFHEYAGTITGPLLAQTHPSQERLYQGMVKLTLRYFRLLEQALKAHQNHRSGRGHRCLHQEWEAAFRTLVAMLDETAEIRLFRQPKMVPAPQEEPRRPKPASVTDALYSALRDVY